MNTLTVTFSAEDLYKPVSFNLGANTSILALIKAYCMELGLRQDDHIFHTNAGEQVKADNTPVSSSLKNTNVIEVTKLRSRIVICTAPKQLDLHSRKVKITVNGVSSPIVFMLRSNTRMKDVMNAYCHNKRISKDLCVFYTDENKEVEDDDTSQSLLFGDKGSMFCKCVF